MLFQHFQPLVINILLWLELMEAPIVLANSFRNGMQFDVERGCFLVKNRSNRPNRVLLKKIKNIYIQNCKNYHFFLKIQQSYWKLFFEDQQLFAGNRSINEYFFHSNETFAIFPSFCEIFSSFINVISQNIQIPWKFHDAFS